MDQEAIKKSIFLCSTFKKSYYLFNNLIKFSVFLFINLDYKNKVIKSHNKHQKFF